MYHLYHRFEKAERILRLLEAELSRGEFSPDDRDGGLAVGLHQNGREQGFEVVLSTFDRSGHLAGTTVSFFEARGSDNIVVTWDYQAYGRPVKRSDAGLVHLGPNAYASAAKLAKQKLLRHYRLAGRQ